ncbi:MAG: helix-turn-helix transcriptional regulator [Cyclobacteriaceae bacterium]|nr:helix-turn-helix transcriptional regulator [Cyclobacteriaceae bacterium]MCB0500860.1 helix-turn-helix transcriptional regulator [Cyclobacteriaceae bacterium]MCB9238441.1 helix-turn-helix transcriptional regulator [Flammeovirgaceae bacterium]MCW5903866.1 helix-turn-helix transcriptional regulator [Cyclobacteriaceae bacterium]
MAHLYIKNMVCNRCVMVVKQMLEGQGLHPVSVALGEVELTEKELAKSQLDRLDSALRDLGFERIDDHKGRLIESIKSKVIQWIRHSDASERKHNWSTLLSEEFHYEYSYLSNLFSSVAGITLEQYIIRQRIERAKELLFYDEMSLGEIAALLGYSSVAHLSGQFKKVTGQTPSALKKSRAMGQQRKPLDGVA